MEKNTYTRIQDAQIYKRISFNNSNVKIIMDTT